MKKFSPLFIAVRVVVYSLLAYGAAELIRFDALYPINNEYFSEVSRTEFAQSAILLVLFVFYLLLGKRYRAVQPVTNFVSLFVLMSLIREQNNFIHWWFWPVLLLFFVAAWLVWRDFSKIKKATVEFFSQPASVWLFAGILVTYVFSRLMGRSKFWLLYYDESIYRFAKSAVEEGLELMGYLLMFFSAIEFSVLVFYKNKES